MVIPTRARLRLPFRHRLRHHLHLHVILLLRRAHHANVVLLPKTIRTIVLTITVRIPTASPTGHAPRVRRASMLLPVSPKWNYRDLMKGLVIEVNAQKGNAVCGLRSLQALTQKMLFSSVIRNVAASPVRTPDHHAHPIPLLGVVHTSPQTTSSLCICPILRLVLLTFGDPSLLPISKISLGGVRKYESIGATLSDPIRHPPPLGGSLGRRPCPFCCPFWLVSNSSTLHTYLSFGTRALLLRSAPRDSHHPPPLHHHYGWSLVVCVLTDTPIRFRGLWVPGGFWWFIHSGTPRYN